MRKKTIEDIDVSGRRVLLRADLNVPLNDEGKVADDTRIRSTLPTIEYLLAQKASVVLMSHLDRPKGKVVESLRLDPVAEDLGGLLGIKVRKLDQVVGEEVERVCDKMSPGDVVLLENLRFDPRETLNDPALAASLARLGEIYVDDAFGASHRAHASTVGVAELLPAVAGLLMEKELVTLEGLLHNPARPFVAVLGGSKIGDKLKVLRRFMELVDALLIGGGMSYTILKVQGLNIGDSIFEEEQMPEVEEVLENTQNERAELLLPEDLVVADAFDKAADTQLVDIDDIPPHWQGLDIGPRTIESYVNRINEAETIFWNGPMGVFEWGPFERGTRIVGEAIAASPAVSVAGGGDTIAAIKRYGLEKGFTHISTGGGAAMELLEGESLPGVEVLQDIDT
jgi:phosphoglycerate kinase